MLNTCENPHPILTEIHNQYRWKFIFDTGENAQSTSMEILNIKRIHERVLEIIQALTVERKIADLG